MSHHEQTLGAKIISGSWKADWFPAGQRCRATSTFLSPRSWFSPLPDQRMQRSVQLSVCDHDHCHRASTVRAFKLSLVCCVTDSRVKARAPFWPSADHPMPEVRLLGVKDDDLLVSGVGGKIHLSEIHTMVDSQKGIRHWTDGIKINVHYPCLEISLLPFSDGVVSSDTGNSAFSWRMSTSHHPLQSGALCLPCSLKKKKKMLFLLHGNNQPN